MITLLGIGLIISLLTNIGVIYQLRDQAHRIQNNEIQIQSHICKCHDKCDTYNLIRSTLIDPTESTN